MPELRLFLKMKHETLRHTIVNFRHRIKLRNSVDTNYLTEMYTYVTAGENKAVRSFEERRSLFWQMCRSVTGKPTASTFMIEESLT
jgi:hypothetical protein